jgi:trk system potassium uptake protein TrkH
VTVPTYSTWSAFGQVVILILIQIGGLGVITVLSGITIALHRKMKLGDSRLISDAFNLNSLEGLGAFIKKVILGTFIVEGVGALLYMPVFVRDFGARGVWIAIFNSISAFCNAGIDIIGDSSLMPYVTDPLINGVTCALVVVSGLGYIVWWDVLRVLKNVRVQGLKCFRFLTLHSKIVLSSTLVLIFGGAALIFAFEYSNAETIANMSLFEKIQASIFQSVTTRTAGFAALDQSALTEGASMVSLFLMFIGGSPVGTAGGIKTVTLVVLALTAYAAIVGRNDVSIFNRSISKQAVRKAVAVAMMSFSIMMISTLLLAFVTDATALEILYETVSATATVGLSKNLTPLLNIWGKIIIICTMYFGRIGPISLAIAFSYQKEIVNNIKDPTEEISVG